LAPFVIFWPFLSPGFLCAGGCEDLLALPGPRWLAGTVATPLAIAPPIRFTFSLPFLYQNNFLKGKGPARRGTKAAQQRRPTTPTPASPASVPGIHPPGFHSLAGVRVVHTILSHSSRLREMSWVLSADLLFPTNG